MCKAESTALCRHVKRLNVAVVPCVRLSTVFTFLLFIFLRMGRFIPFARCIWLLVCLFSLLNAKSQTVINWWFQHSAREVFFPLPRPCPSYGLTHTHTSQPFWTDNSAYAITIIPNLSDRNDHGQYIPQRGAFSVDEAVFNKTKMVIIIARN